MSFVPMSPRFEQFLRTRVGPVGEQARLTWQRRTRREQTLLRSAAVLLAAALVWLIGLQPALERIRIARAQLPVVQAQASHLDTIILEAQAMGRSHSGVLSAADTGQALQASLRNSGLDAFTEFSVQPDAKNSETLWQISFVNAPAGRLIEWVSRLAFVTQVQTRQVDLTRSSVEGRDRPGHLTGRVVLALPAKEAP